jgi:hypothetical protein
VDFSFQNFSNRRKKNNQLDTLVLTQYFSATSHDTYCGLGRGFKPSGEHSRWRAPSA